MLSQSLYNTAAEAVSEKLRYSRYGDDPKNGGGFSVHAVEEGFSVTRVGAEDHGGNYEHHVLPTARSSTYSSSYADAEQWGHDTPPRGVEQFSSGVQQGTTDDEDGGIFMGGHHQERQREHLTSTPEGYYHLHASVDMYDAGGGCCEENFSSSTTSGAALLQHQQGSNTPYGDPAGGVLQRGSRIEPPAMSPTLAPGGSHGPRISGATCPPGIGGAHSAGDSPSGMLRHRACYVAAHPTSRDPPSIPSIPPPLGPPNRERRNFWTKFFQVGPAIPIWKVLGWSDRVGFWNGVGYRRRRS